MKEILMAIVASLENYSAKLVAIESFLITDGTIDRSKLQAIESVSLDEISRQLSSLRAAISSLPE